MSLQHKFYFPLINKNKKTNNKNFSLHADIFMHTYGYIFSERTRTNRCFFPLCNWADSLCVSLCVGQEGDSLGAMEKVCRQLTYHLSPHSQWRRQGLLKRKPQAWWVSLYVCLCVTVVQYVPLFLLTSQCVTDVSSSAAPLDAMGKYFLSSLPSHVDFNITLDVLPLTIQFFFFTTDSSVKVMSHIYCIQNKYLLIVFLLAYVLNDRQMTEH